MDAGADQETVTCPFPAIAVTPVGAPGADPADGVTEEEADDADELPIAFVATTVNVRGVPFVNPVTVAVRTLPTVTELPEEGVTV